MEHERSGPGPPTRPGARLLAGVIVGLVCLVAALGPAPPARAADSPGWGWPLGADGAAPEVVARFDPPAAPWLPGHRGVDLRGSPGDPVRAAGAGVVAFAGPVAGVPVVTVRHPGGLRTTYQPVAAAVRRGDRVARGQLLGGLVGVPSHCAPQACLHWGLLRGATYLDPMSLLDAPAPVRLLPVWTAYPPVVPP